ncbi:hypothetical protein M9978_10245 [Sphingomonas sp. MG17]|uniref:Uncharacterized protein n=1 Tax=Sphingomonas tagetis TaxID=2949092 RepID=A0A9X2KLH4_9SPHN|nr:hypothetical protein [Sphingomonas tagetis]MCP3730810.1 hypothetical protein [Sphingomonas tagetis]
MIQNEETVLKLPFPAYRLSTLGNMIIPSAIERGVRLRSIKPDIETIYRSCFLNTYVCVYPSFLAENYPEIGHFVRWSLLRMLFTCDHANAQLRWDTFCARLEGQDTEVTTAAELAWKDGRHCFKALLEDRDPDISATENLVSAIGSIRSFPQYKIYY